MNQDGTFVSRDHLFKKCLGSFEGGVHAVERCEVVVAGKNLRDFNIITTQGSFVSFSIPPGQDTSPS